MESVTFSQPGLFLYNIWYMALPGALLKRGKTLAKTLLGQPLLFGRGENGEVFAVRDICPHRGIPLHYGRFDGREIECCYHGWRFDMAGQCTLIPSLVKDQRLDPSRIRVAHYPCREAQGLVWVFMGAPAQTVPIPLPEIPRVPDVEGRSYALMERKRFACSIDHAVIGLMDPAHGPFVHRQWWWRSGRSRHEKSKQFAPSDLGFKMLRHPPSSNSRAYKILGGEITTEITFRLPGVRLEHIQAGRRVVCALTTLTPLNEQETEIHQFFYSNISGFPVLTPFLRPFVRAFLNQDHGVVMKQQEGLRYAPRLMLINDADSQAKWYYALKKEYIQAQQERREFRNPVTETVLRWSS